MLLWVDKSIEGAWMDMICDICGKKKPVTNFAGPYHVIGICDDCLDEHLKDAKSVSVWIENEEDVDGLCEMLKISVKEQGRFLLTIDFKKEETE